jgi:hypothetical protein
LTLTFLLVDTRILPYGIDLYFNPHLHVVATDGCFYNDAAFMVCSPPDTGELASGS